MICLGCNKNDNKYFLCKHCVNFKKHKRIVKKILYKNNIYDFDINTLFLVLSNMYFDKDKKFEHIAKINNFVNYYYTAVINISNISDTNDDIKKDKPIVKIEVGKFIID